MNARLKSMIDQLEEIYASLPEIDCKGDCWNSCGAIDMSTAERQRIVQLGVLIPVFTEEWARRWQNDEPVHCPALNKQTLRCDVYEARPLICRLWGLGEGLMACPNGCKPTRVLDDVELYQLIFKSYLAGGHSDFTKQQGEEFIAVLKDPQVGPLMVRFIRGDRSVEPLLKSVFAGKPKGS